MSARRRIQFTGAVTIAAAVALVPVAGWGHPAWWAPVVLTLALAAVWAGSVRIFIGRQAFAFSLADALLTLALVLAPGAWIAIAYAAGLAITVGRRVSREKLLFNVEEGLFSAVAACAVTEALGGGVRAALAGAVTFAVSNHLVTTVPVALSSGNRYRRVLMATGPLGLIHNAGNISVGLLAGWLAIHAPWGLLGLVVPLGLLWWSYQQQTRRTSEARLFAELAQGQERAAGGTVDASAQVIVTAAARVFGGTEVEMVLRHPDGPMRYVGDERGVRTRARTAADGFDAPWVLRALGARGLLVGLENGSPFCSAVLGDPDHPLAVLIARRPPGAGSYARADTQLAEVLVRQAESWLSVADLTAKHDMAVGQAEAYGAASRVLGDLRTETVPALAVLRESANRLSRLASAFDGPDPVTEIVSELHAVERAVATLLGAIALASDPNMTEDAAAATDGPGVTRSETEWTTTGRLEDAVER